MDEKNNFKNTGDNKKEKIDNISNTAENNIFKENLPYSKPIANNSAKTKVQLSPFDIITFAANFILTYLLISAVIDFGFSYKTTLVYLGIFALATVYIILKQKLFRKEAVLPGVSAVLTSLTFALHSNYEINVVSFFLLMYLSGSYCIKLTGSNRHSAGSYFYIIDVIKSEVLLPIKNIFLPLLSLGTLRKSKVSKGQKNNKKIFSIILGMLLGIPVLVVVIPLLLRGDAAFENLIGTTAENISKWFSDIFSKLFDNFDLFDYILFLIPTLIFAPYIYSVMFSFRHGITNGQNKDTSSKYKKLRFASPNLIGGFLGIISLVYVIFLFSQLSYFFSAFSGHLPGGMEFTVAEYARHGFFEMTQIAGINFVIIAVSVLFAKRKDNNKLSEVVKWLDLFLCIFTIILISTSISKIVLYISSFGLTHKRIYVFIFDIVLIFVFLSVIIRLFKEKFPYMKVIISASCLAVIALGFLNVDGIVAKNNVRLYLSGKTDRIGIYQIYELYPAGLESLDNLTLSDDQDISNQAKMFIADIIGNKHFFFYANLTGIPTKLPLTLDSYKAEKYIEKNKERFTEYKNQYYSNPDDIFLFLNTKTKIKSVSITDGYSWYESEKHSECLNFDLMQFSIDRNNFIKGEIKDAFYKEDNEKFVDKMIIIEDENGKKHNVFIYYENYNASIVEIAENKNGFFAKKVYDQAVTYNSAVKEMNRIRNS